MTGTDDELAARAVGAGDHPGIRTVLDRLCALTGMGFSAVALVNEKRWIACQVEDRIGFGMEPGGELEIKTTICDEVRDRGKAIVIDNTSENPDWWSHPTPILYGFKSYLSIPLYSDDGAFFGTLCAIDPEPRRDPLIRHMAALGQMAREVMALLPESIGGADEETLVKRGS